MAIAEKEGFGMGPLSYCFCSDDHLLEINKEYLQHNYYTDIITFDLSDGASSIEGDIYISVDRVKENAKNMGVSTRMELMRVMVHGLLHLMGYKDKTPGQKSKMRKQEDLYLLLFDGMFHVK